MGESTFVGRSPLETFPQQYTRHHSIQIGVCGNYQMPTVTDAAAMFSDAIRCKEASDKAVQVVAGNPAVLRVYHRQLPTAAACHSCKSLLVTKT